MPEWVMPFVYGLSVGWLGGTVFVFWYVRR